MWTQWSEWMDVLRKTSPEEARSVQGGNPDRPNRAAAQSVVTLLKALGQALDSFTTKTNARDCHWVADLANLPRGAATLLARTLGGGEVSVSLCNEAGTVEETGVRGVWLLRVGGQRSLVAALLPRVVESFIEHGDAVVKVSEPSVKVSPAATAVLAEANEALRVLSTRDAQVCVQRESLDSSPFQRQIDLLRQPFGAGDLRYILSVIGTGEVSVVLRGFSRSRIDSTRVRGLWRSRIANTEGRLLFDSLVVARIPREIPAGREDFEKSATRVRELTASLESDLFQGRFDGLRTPLSQR